MILSIRHTIWIFHRSGYAVVVADHVNSDLGRRHKRLADAVSRHQHALGIVYSRFVELALPGIWPPLRKFRTGHIPVEFCNELCLTLLLLYCELVHSLNALMMLDAVSSSNTMR
jgi:hypothetical protein